MMPHAVIIDPELLQRVAEVHAIVGVLVVGLAWMVAGIWAVRS